MERVDLRKGDVIDRRYQVQCSLGEGSFGQVFRVTDNARGQFVALKLLKMWCISPEDREQLTKRFDMEYATGQISSPYLVHSLGKGEYRGNPYIVMEYCDGGDLLHAMNNHSVDIVRASVQVLHGLSALHNNGKVHRDLKPENVLIRHDGTAVLTDFGISGDQNNRVTRRGILGTPKEIMGTFIYMPPEQVRPPTGNATVLPTTDIFSCGVMLYQLLTGELPFGSLHTDDDMERYCENSRTGRWNRVPLAKQPNAEMWTRIIEGCLRPNYKKRLQSVNEVLDLMPEVEGNPPVRQPFTGNKTQSFEKWQLKVMQGEEVGRIYKLLPRPQDRVLRMGRQSLSVENDLPILETDSSFISRAHCTFDWDAEEKRWYLWDGQWVDNTGSGYWKPSLNGTYVGSRQATTDDAIPLSDGDIISIGDVKIKVEGL